MSNETTMVREDAIAKNYTCANGTGIEKGAILKLTSPLTASLSDGLNDKVAGIAQSEKIASDGITSVAVHRSGLFKVVCCGTLSAGDPVTTNGVFTNTVIIATTNDENILGYMTEDATEGQTKVMELRPTTMQLA